MKGTIVPVTQILSLFEVRLSVPLTLKQCGSTLFWFN
jgi:hypothetical protein